MKFRGFKIGMSLMVGCSLLLSNSVAMAGGTVTGSEIYQTAATAKIKYNDYSSSQYWSQDMLWAIDRGLIQGYLNTNHPSNKNLKTKGNWLDPQGELSEAQMLAILFRYAKPNELAQTKPIKTWWASVPYQLAEKYKLPTKASLKDTKNAGSVISRGDLARVLASLHLGEPVNVYQAIEFMYDANISSGTDKTQGKTYSNFGADDQLVRANIVSFMKRYDNFLKNGGKLPEKSALIAPSEYHQVGSMIVRYEGHTYRIWKQEEYDRVMSHIETEIIKSYSSIQFSDDPVENAYYLEYLDGARGIRDRNNPAYWDMRNRTLVLAESFLGGLVEAGLSKNSIIKFHKGIELSQKLAWNSEYPTGEYSLKGASNAYTHLINKKGNDYTEPLVYSAVFNTLGYKTQFITATINNYIFSGVLINVDGKWIDPSNTFDSKFTEVNLKEAEKQGWYGSSYQ